MISILLRLNVHFAVYSGIAVIAFAFICSLIDIKKKPISMKFLSLFLSCSLIIEVLAAYFNVKYRNNLAIYQIMGPVVMAGSSLYFNYCIPSLKKYHVGYITAAIGIVYTAINIIFLGGLNRLNTNFAQVECLINVCFCFFFFFRYINSDDIITFKRDPYFWNALLFLTFYLGTFLSWGMIHMLVRHNIKAVGVVYLIVYLLNIVFYIGLGIVALILRRPILERNVAKDKTVIILKKKWR